MRLMAKEHIYMFFPTLLYTFGLMQLTRRCDAYGEKYGNFFAVFFFNAFEGMFLLFSLSSSLRFHKQL